MLLGPRNTVVDPRSANEISEAAKATPKQIARNREARREEERAAVRERLLNPPMEHVDTVSETFYSSSSQRNR